VGDRTLILGVAGVACDLLGLLYGLDLAPIVGRRAAAAVSML
jgi:hypothetical protein